MVSCLSKLSSHDLAYCHEQDIESQQPVFPAAQWSNKSSSACAMDGYVKVLNFTPCRKVNFDIRLLYFTIAPYGDSAELVLPMAHTQRFYCVLHALRGCRATKLGTWECPHSMLLLCFTRFERMPGNKVDSLGVPSFNVSIMFYTL